MDSALDPLAPILNRHSCRAFLKDPIPHGDLDRLLEAMRQAPSAGNTQPWRFIVVHDPSTRHALAAAAYGQDFMAEPPVVIIVCADPDRCATVYGERGRTLYVIQDTAAAVENLLIAAAALGYGTCWIGAFDEDAVSSVLGLPSHLRPVAMVPVGRAAAPPTNRPRRAMSEIVELR
jgi:nitroreductase